MITIFTNMKKQKILSIIWLKKNYTIKEDQSILEETVSKLVGDTNWEREIPNITEHMMSLFTYEQRSKTLMNFTTFSKLSHIIIHIIQNKSETVAHLVFQTLAAYKDERRKTKEGRNSRSKIIKDWGK